MTYTQQEAPFTNEQVDILVKHQLNRKTHPYTCGECESRLPLIVSKYGFECYYCGYKQSRALLPEQEV